MGLCGTHGDGVLLVPPRSCPDPRFHLCCVCVIERRGGRLVLEPDRPALPPPSHGRTSPGAGGGAPTRSGRSASPLFGKSQFFSAGAQAQQSVSGRPEGERRAGCHRPALLRRPQPRRRHEPHRHAEPHPEPQGQKVRGGQTHSGARALSPSHTTCLSAGLLQGSSHLTVVAVHLVCPPVRRLHPPAALPRSPPLGRPRASPLLQTARRTTERQTVTRTRRH